MIVHPVTVRADQGDAQPTSSHAKRRGGLSFGEFLSCLNPLQYLPVVGTIYRAITGDEIPARLREAGSLAVSFLTGGPAGLGLALGIDVAEHATGFDPEALGRRLVASVGLGHAAPGAPPPDPAPDLAPSGEASDLAFASGATAAMPGFGGVQDADALNAIELQRLAADAQRRLALDAYAHTRSLIG